MPGNEVTLADLAGDDEGGSGGDSDTGEFIMEIFDRLDERGMIEPLIFGPDAADGQPADRPQPDDTQMSQTEPAELDAESIKSVLLKLYDNAEMIPGVSDDPTVSELIKLIENHPDRANQMIQNFMGE